MTQHVLQIKLPGLVLPFIRYHDPGGRYSFEVMQDERGEQYLRIRYTGYNKGIAIHVFGKKIWEGEHEAWSFTHFAPVAADRPILIDVLRLE